MLLQDLEWIFRGVLIEKYISEEIIFYYFRKIRIRILIRNICRIMYNVFGMIRGSVELGLYMFFFFCIKNKIFMNILLECLYL